MIRSVFTTVLQDDGYNVKRPDIYVFYYRKSYSVRKIKSWKRELQTLINSLRLLNHQLTDILFTKAVQC